MDYQKVSTQNCIAFVNGKSGGCLGQRVIAKLKKLLPPHRVYDLMEPPIGPLKGLINHTEEKDLRVICCGGDGTVGWVLSVIDKIPEYVNGTYPAVAVIPLGTGNDLSRILRWGSGYGGEDLTPVIDKILYHSFLVKMDRWKLTIQDISPEEFFQDEPHKAGLETSRKPEQPTSPAPHRPPLPKPTDLSASHEPREPVRPPQPLPVDIPFLPGEAPLAASQPARPRTRQQQQRPQPSSPPSRSTESEISLRKCEAPETPKKPPPVGFPSVHEPVVCAPSKPLTESPKSPLGESQRLDTPPTKPRRPSGDPRHREEGAAISKRDEISAYNLNIRVRPTDSISDPEKRTEFTSEDSPKQSPTTSTFDQMTVLSPREGEDEEEFSWTVSELDALGLSENVPDDDNGLGYAEHPITPRTRMERHQSYLNPIRVSSYLFDDEPVDTDHLEIDEEENTQGPERPHHQAPGGFAPPRPQAPLRPKLPLPKPEFKDDQPKQMLINNYFSIGIDSKVALSFHTLRNNHPQLFSSKYVNMAWYGGLGVKTMIEPYSDLTKVVIMKVDGKITPIPRGIKAIILLNIPSYAGGTDPWGAPRPRQSINDKKIEIVGLKGAAHVGAISAKVSSGVRIGQATDLAFFLRDIVHAQVDGEPFFIGPTSFKVEFFNQANMLFNGFGDHLGVRFNQLCGKDEEEIH